MQTIRQLVENWCKAHQVNVQATEDQLCFWVDGANGQFPAALLPLEEERALVCLFGVGPYVPPAGREAAALRLAELNYPLKIGAVQLHGETGELTFRATQFLPEEDGAASVLVNRLLTACASAMDQLLPTLTHLCCL